MVGLLLIGITIHAQVQEDFSDGDFTSNPVWLGVDTVWQINSGMLQSYSHTANSAFVLATANTRILNTEWRWRSKLDFSTSSANYVDFFLNANQSDLSGDAYFVRIGNTKDEISLYKRLNGNTTLLIDGPDGQVSGQSDFAIKVVHQAGVWELYAQDLEVPGATMNSIDTVVDQSISSAAFFGISVRQSTPSFFEKHFFDDIYVGDIVVDTIGPTLEALLVQSSSVLELKMNETLDSDLSSASFDIQGIGSALHASLVPSDPSVVRIEFPSPFSTGVNTLHFDGLRDLDGNIQDPETTNFTYAPIQPYSVLISEVMSDYNPSQGLPEVKYLELLNPGNTSIDLEGWMLIEGTKTMTLPSYLLPAGGYVLVSSSSAVSDLQVYGDVITASYFPSLSVNGSSLRLHDTDSNLIHSMSYDKSSYDSEIKAKGGYSLELIDPQKPCISRENYTSSIASIGGTPGASNSVQNTLSLDPNLRIVHYDIIDSQRVIVRLDRHLDRGPWSSISATLDGQSMVVEDPFGSQNLNELTLIAPADWEESRVYELRISGIQCCGQIQNDLYKEIGESSVPDVGDLLINEIMFESQEGYSDWIEIYNASDKIIRTQDLLLASRDELGTLKDIEPLGPGTHILPSHFVVLSSDDPQLLHQLYPKSLIEDLHQLIFSYSLRADQDRIVLLNSAEVVLDELQYDRDWHFALLNETKGVSLERVSYTATTQDQDNWHSAAESIGYATPTRANSARRNTNSAEIFGVDRRVISPNGDGKDDFLLLEYNLGQPGYLMNMRLYDLSGAERANLLDNETISSAGVIQWDGRDRYGDLIPSGLYILWIEAHDLQGNREQNKISITVVN